MALRPNALLLAPVVLVFNAEFPNALLKSAVVFEVKAVVPNALLNWPVELAYSD